jgi:hypothetical protein
LPPLDLLIVLCVVLSMRQFSTYRRSPWPAGTERARRLHFAFLAVGTFVGLLAELAIPDLRPAPGGGGGAATQTVLALHAWAFTLLALAAPFALLWLTSADFIKVHGRLDTVAMVRARFRGGLRAIRDWLPLLALVYAYGLLEPVIGRGLVGDLDGPLARVDRALFLGRDPAVLLSGIIARPLSTWLSACYVLYVPLLPLVLGLVFAKRDPGPFRELALAVTLVLAVGYVGYTLVPAQGPLFVQHFDVSLDGYYGDWIRRDLMDPARVPRDCFPSLHTAVSLTLLWGAWRHLRPLFWCVLPVVLSIPFACVYFRYHYVADVLAGVLLFVAAASVAARIHTTSLQQGHTTDTLPELDQ